MNAKMSRRAAVATGAVGIAMVGSPRRGQAQATAKPKKGAPIVLSPSLLKTKRVRDAKPATDVVVKVEVINDTSVAITSGEVAMSDTSGSGDPVVKTVEFGRISSGSTARKTKSFPTGIEQVITRFYFHGDPEPYVNIGFGVDATEIEIKFVD